MNVISHVTLLNIAISLYYDKDSTKFFHEFFSFKLELSIVHEMVLLLLNMVNTRDTFPSLKQRKLIHQCTKQALFKNDFKLRWLQIVFSLK